MSVPDKPLPNDPGLPTVPAVRNTQKPVHRIMMSKSVTDLRSTQHVRDDEAGRKSQAPRRMSLSDAAEEPVDPAAGSTVKLNRKFSQRFTRTFRAKKSIGKKSEIAENRPGLSGPNGKTMKPRSTPFEQLRAAQMNQKSQRPAVPESLAPEDNELANQISAPGDNMKDQLSLFFKSDSAIDEWVTSNEKGPQTSRLPSVRKIDWPLSIFRTKSSSALRGQTGVYGTEASPAELCGTEIDNSKQAAGLEETRKEQIASKILQTYWLKPSGNSSPKLPVFAVQSMVAADIEHQKSESNAESPRTPVAELP